MRGTREDVFFAIAEVIWEETRDEGREMTGLQDDEAGAGDGLVHGIAR